MMIKLIIWKLMIIDVSVNITNNITSMTNWLSMAMHESNLITDITNRLSEIIANSGGRDSNPHVLVLVFTIVIATALICIIPKDELRALRNCALMFSTYYLLLCFHMGYVFNADGIFETASKFHFPYSIPLIPEYEIILSFGIDGISFWFLVLTGFIMTICIFALSPKEKNYKTYLIYLFLVYTFLTISFSVTDLLFFFVFFESVLIPMFFIIGIWGTRARKVRAAYYFFFYTLFGSFFLLYGIYEVYSITGSLSYEVLLNFSFSHTQQLYLWFFFFLPFAIKIPMIPFHIWLPEAHVEAPTVGSMILAALLLKLGGYGFIRFTISMFPFASFHFQNFVYVLAAVSVLYASAAAIRQSDLKRIVAYTSIAHMNLIVIGIFSLKHQGIEGSVFLMLGHGLVSAALFFCVGILSDRHHTRQIKNFSGLVQTMPVFSVFFFIFTLANMSFPGTSNFPGELLILGGILQTNPWVVLLAGSGIVLSAIYSIWIFNRIFFGTLKNEKQNTTNYADLNRNEFLVLSYLAAPMLIMGLSSSFITALLFIPIKRIIKNSVFKGRYF